jgi:hypothetical protein
MKTGLQAAQYYFNDNLTEAYRLRDVHGWNLSHGLYFLAQSLERIERQISELHDALPPQPNPAPQRRRYGKPG